MYERQTQASAQCSLVQKLIYMEKEVDTDLSTRTGLSRTLSTAPNATICHQIWPRNRGRHISLSAR